MCIRDRYYLLLPHHDARHGETYGERLHDMINDWRKHPPDKGLLDRLGRVLTMKHIAEAVACLHSKDIAHGDLRA